MPLSSRLRRTATAVAWLTAGAVGATALTGLAVAAGPGAAGTSGAGTSVSAPESLSAAAGPRRGLLRNALHAEITVSKDGTVQTIAVQRGKVTAASATSVTLESTDGYRATYVIGDDTVVRRDRAVVDGDALEVGDRALVRATEGEASVVRAVSAERAAKAADGSAGDPAGGLFGGAGGVG